MTKQKKMVMTVIILFLLITGISSVDARSVEVDYVNIVAQVNPDGSMDVTEYYDVEFEGQWHGMFRWINLRENESLSNVSVFENGEAFTHHPNSPENSVEEITKHHNNQVFSYWIGPPGTFTMVERGNSIFLDWSINAYNTQKTYAFQYRVNNAVIIHNDVAEIYHQFIGDEWEIPFGNATVQLELPAGAQRDEIRAWGHGPLYGEVDILSGNEIVWHVAPLPAETMLEGRVTFPTTLVPQGTNLSGSTGLDSILAEEQEWAREANRERRMARIDLYGAPIAFLSVAAAFLIKRRRFKKYHKAEFVGDYYRELPGDYSPAILGQLWNKKQHKPEILMATIMDLARRGYLMIHEFVPEKKGFFKRGRDIDYMLVSQGKSLDDLSPYEQKLLSMLFKDVGQMNAEQQNAQVSLGQIEEYTKKKSTGKQFHGQYTGFCAAIEVAAERHGFFESLKKNNLFVHVLQAGGAIVAGIAAMRLLGMNYLGLGFILAGILGILTLIGMMRYSKKGLEDYVRWKAFRKFLQDFSAMDQHQIPSLVIWEQYLVYAIPLGVADEVIKQLKVVFPNMEQDGRRFGYGWYASAGMMNFDGFNRMISDSEKSITRSLRDSQKVARSSNSSGSGGGGGFSGGGGGGSGGGGGGFR